MHDEQARNRSFDVGYEYESTESEYELITQVKSSKNGNYLTPRRVAERNTSRRANVNVR